MRDEVQPNRPAWHPRMKDGKERPGPLRRCNALQRQFLLLSGTPAANIKPAGKGRGRQYGYHPAQENAIQSFSKPKKHKSRLKPANIRPQLGQFTICFLVKVQFHQTHFIAP
jgi:hypothetical protein